ncbi:hypothetical protein PV433_30895 [Paenibacillus sp. GYB004]|uniref:VVA0879 family protein n=1 Tax=Paenibacillus sp. GYB004 TaxID=2994393 RepID=UPI002F9626A8
MKQQMSKPKMVRQTLKEWQAEAAERFGQSARHWKFVCPSCGNVQSAFDFIGLVKGGGDEVVSQAANSAYQECIGRVDETSSGCNWAAYGFLGTLGKGRIVVTPGGKEVEVFDFALDAIS